MGRDLLDVLWRDHPDATAPRRGPRPKVSPSEVVAAAVAVADADGLAAVTVRRLAAHLDIAPNALYTHVGSRDDLLVLMADAVRTQHPPPRWTGTTWRPRVHELADAELALCLAHPWLLDVSDERTAFGPGTITTYDRQLRVFDGAGLDDVTRDAALTFVTGFVHASARARLPHRRVDGTAWAAWQGRLTAYLGRDAPLARRVGAAAGAAMDGPSSTEHAWRFGLARVLEALDALVASAARRTAEPRAPRTTYPRTT